MKKSLQLMLLFAMPAIVLTGLATSLGAQTTTNGNGDSVDVGTWYCPNFSIPRNSWWKLTSMRGLLPDGTYGEYNTDDPAIIDFHLEKIAEAKFDFIVFDETNGNFNNYAPDDQWEAEHAKVMCSRIKIWNQNHARKIKYAFSIGAWFMNRRHFPTATSYDVVEQQARCILTEVINNSAYNASDYYQVNGKPLLVVLDYHLDKLDRWNSYTGSKTNANQFTIRWAGSGADYRCGNGDYGWAMNMNGMLLNREVEYLQPGTDAHIKAAQITYRDFGDTYVNYWTAILTNPLPKIVMIGAFNDLTEDSAIFPTDTSTDYPGTRLPIERWYGHDGKLHPTMYWDYTVGMISTLKFGTPRPYMAGLVSGRGPGIH